MPRETISLNSSALASATYDSDAQTLDITFNNGRTYTYADITPQIFKELAESDSPGRYWATNIKVLG